MSTTSLLDECALSVTGRMDDLDDRIDALTTKLDIATEAMRGDVKALLDRLDSLGAEVRREVATVRKEQWSDHRTLVALLKDHGRLLELLERSARATRCRCKNDVTAGANQQERVR